MKRCLLAAMVVKSLKYISLIAIVICLAACGNNREQEMEKFRQKVREQYLERKLIEAQLQLAHTDSLLQEREAHEDSIHAPKRAYQDSLELAADVQGAQIRYIHKKQKELQ
ncbi:hypothetical protein SAMN02910409_1287 [Prevotellaceae bacterium HUN156]|nr:hypothetical protein SAMN02910409_1287 [Prevotellaceae bacterium HUN156]